VRPGTSTRVFDFNGVSLFSVTVPTCPSCRPRLRLWQLWDKFRTILIGAGAVAFGIAVLLPVLPGWATGLIVLGLCVLGFGVIFVWNRRFPPAFALDAGRPPVVDYEFADGSVAEEFAALNGAVPSDEPSPEPESDR
jgi:hypothetical protein